MKKLRQTFLGLIALTGVVVVFTQCEKKDATASSIPAVGGVSTELLPLAYVDADSLVAHLDFHKRLADAFETKLSKQNAALNAAGQKLQNEVIAFQQKMQNNAFLSQERAQQEQTRIQRMQADLEKRADQVQQELAVERSNIQLQLNDSLVAGVKAFNTPQKYQMIITKSAMLYADERYDITAEVTTFLNKRFK
ncbi:membrane protein [Bacteroidia bacterium]|nr:membrane protein [Bacteroidia bacterium]